MNTRIPVASSLLLAVVLAVSGCGSSEPAAPVAATNDHGNAEGGHAEGEGEESEEGRVHLTPAQIEAAGIGLATVGPASIRETLSVYGSIAPNAERVRDVSARFAGVISSVDKKIGDAVRQGETLATVESNESLRTYAVTAPLAGVITERSANAGEQTGDRKLFTVADLSTVWVELSLFPRDRARVQVGQPVRVRSADSGLSADGRVVYVAPFGSSASQTLTARVQLANPERRWAPGLYVSADVVLSESPAPLTIRNEAIQIMEGQSSIFVEEEPGEFVPYPVQLGRSDGEVTEILRGLQAGQRYATVNSFILKAQMGAGSAEHGH
ncbi:MAG: efflux RND transporter periplasmic adaptor subunit [Gammaproteobacteria bacterium]|nr:efflux RND transporter periplasmic adaptor subunit [Gammaproteobacteria bacterium]